MLGIYPTVHITLTTLLCIPYSLHPTVNMPHKPCYACTLQHMNRVSLLRIQFIFSSTYGAFTLVLSTHTPYCIYATTHTLYTCYYAYILHTLHYT
jgi:hypothetical protein